MQIAHVSGKRGRSPHGSPLQNSTLPLRYAQLAMHYAWPFVLTRSCTNPIPMAVAQDM